MSKRHHMARGPAFFLSALLVPAFVMAGCEVPPPEDDPAADPQMQQPAEMENDTVEFSAGLSDIEDSGVSGEVRVQRPRANHAVTMIVEVEDLPREGEFPVALHRGSCDQLTDDWFDWGDDPQQTQQQDQVGARVAELSAVRGFADGTGMSQSTLQTADLPLQDDLVIVIHGEQPGQQQPGQPIACADIDADDWERDRTGDRGWNN